MMPNSADTNISVTRSLWDHPGVGWEMPVVSWEIYLHLLHILNFCLTKWDILSHVPLFFIGLCCSLWSNYLQFNDIKMNSTKHETRWYIVPTWRINASVTSVVLGFGITTCTQQYTDVIKWKHLPRYWPFVRGIHPSPVNSQHKGQWRRALIFSLICVNKRLNK